MKVPSDELSRKSSALNLLLRLKFQMKSRTKETTEVLRGKIQRLKDACHAMDVDEKGWLERNRVRISLNVISPPFLCTAVGLYEYGLKGKGL